MSFILFAGNDYYPEGGARDVVGSKVFDSVAEAVAAHNPTEFIYNGGWANILDIDTMQMAASFSRGTWYQGDTSNPYFAECSDA